MGMRVVDYRVCLNCGGHASVHALADVDGWEVIGYRVAFCERCKTWWDA
jgi:hypothetical protein